MSVAGSATRRRAVALLLALTAGCYQSSAPPKWLPSPEEAQRDAFGSHGFLLAADPARGPQHADW